MVKKISGESMIFFVNTAYITSILISLALAYPLKLVKLGFSTAFLSSAFTLFFYIFQTRKSKLNIKKQLMYILYFGAAACLSNFITLISSSKLVSLLSYTAFFICIDGIVYNLFIFSIKYTNYKFKFPSLKKILLALFIADSTAIVLNIFPKYMFDLKPIYLAGEISYKIIQKLPYQIHLAFSYITLLGIIILFTMKIINVPHIYKNKYRASLFSLLIVILLDAVYVFIPNAIDYSIIFFGLAGVCLTWSSLHYTPKKLLSVSMNLVVESMHDGVIFFDADGECVYRNKAFDELIETYNKVGLNLMQPLDSWRNNKIFRERNLRYVFNDHKFNQQFTIGKKTYYFTFWFQNLTEDSTNKHIGFFSIIHDRTQEEDAINKERFLASHDSLTGLYNSMYFYEKVKRTLETDTDNEYIMICSDFDNFKLLNNVLGTEAGDNFLIQTAHLIKTYIRSNGIYARLHSDKFALFIKKEYYSERKFAAGIERVGKINKEFLYPLSVYIGVYDISDTSIPISVMCNRAFTAISTIKGSHTQHIAYYNEGLIEKAVKEQKFINDFKRALERRQFLTFLQPQVSADGKLFGAEVLVRWYNPSEGLVGPEEFIPLLEKKGLIIELDKFIWENAAKLLNKWGKIGLNHYISVNISPIDFCYADIYKTFTSLVKKYDIDPKMLKLEIAESDVLWDLERRQEVISKLRKFGFDIVLDGFGKRYSSFKNPKYLTFNILKIDMPTSYKNHNSERAQTILKSIVNMAKELDIQVIPVGVETEKQVSFLKSIGCERFQGFYFDQPMTVEEFKYKYFPDMLDLDEDDDTDIDDIDDIDDDVNSFYAPH